MIILDTNEKKYVMKVRKPGHESQRMTLKCETG